MVGGYTVPNPGLGEQCTTSVFASLTSPQGTPSIVEVQVGPTSTITVSTSPDTTAGTFYLTAALGSPNEYGLFVWRIPVQQPTPPGLPSPPGQNCPTPSLTSVEPADWPAGKTTPVTLWGTGFACQGAPQISNMNVTPSQLGSTVQVSPMKIIGPDEITFTATPDSDDPTQPATIDLYGIPVVVLVTRGPSRSISDASSNGQNGNPVATGNATIQGPCHVEKPEADASYELSENNYTATEPIQFKAAGAGPSEPVSWKVTIHYATSGGFADTTLTKTFTSTGNTQTSQTFTAVGGQLTVTATCGSHTSNPVVFTVTGTAIPSGTVLQQLTSAYNGPTAGLMRGIALIESSRLQFFTKTLFDVTALWPHESPKSKSFGAGKYIGLLSFPASITDAFNWQSNIQDGIGLFGQKLAIARSLEVRIIATRPGLPPLRADQLEKMAVELYGDSPGPTFSTQYYVADCVGGTVAQSGKQYLCQTPGSWQWVDNPTGNPGGFLYVSRVYGAINR